MSQEYDVLIEDDAQSIEIEDKITNMELFLKLASGSRIVSVKEFVGEYSRLKFGNGGTWCRMDSCFAKSHYYVIRKMNGKLSFSWTPDAIERETIMNDFKVFNPEKGNSISHIKVYGKKDYNKDSRAIREDIRVSFKDSLCVVCGNSDIEIDHKNGLYNDPRVLSSETQTRDDFQALCRHCNQQKRQSMVITRSLGKRYKATNIPQLKVFGVDFIKGNEDYDENDVDAMVGTYWYDPIEFMRKLAKNDL